MATMRKSLLVSVFVFAVIVSAVSSNAEDIPSNPYPHCYAKCSKSYGSNECRTDCIKKKFADGKCLDKRPHHSEVQNCCCNA